MQSWLNIIAPTNTGFLMNYLFNKDKTLFTYDNKKIQVEVIILIKI